MIANNQLAHRLDNTQNMHNTKMLMWNLDAKNFSYGSIFFIVMLLFDFIIIFVVVVVILSIASMMWT